MSTFAVLQAQVLTGFIQWLTSQTGHNALEKGSLLPVQSVDVC